METFLHPLIEGKSSKEVINKEGTNSINQIIIPKINSPNFLMGNSLTKILKYQERNIWMRKNQIQIQNKKDLQL